MSEEVDPAGHAELLGPATEPGEVLLVAERRVTGELQAHVARAERPRERLEEQVLALPRVDAREHADRADRRRLHVTDGAAAPTRRPDALGITSAGTPGRRYARADSSVARELAMTPSARGSTTRTMSAHPARPSDSGSTRSRRCTTSGFRDQRTASAP